MKEVYLAYEQRKEDEERNESLEARTRKTALEKEKEFEERELRTEIIEMDFHVLEEMPMDNIE